MSSSNTPSNRLTRENLQRLDYQTPSSQSANTSNKQSSRPFRQTPPYYPKYEIEGTKGNDVDITLESSPGVINGYIQEWIDFALHFWQRDESLCDDFKAEFYNWIKEIFDKADTKVLKDLRNFLRGNGVFVYTHRGKSISTELVDTLLEEKEPYIWTDDEVRQVMKETKGHFNSKYNKERLPEPYSPQPEKKPQPKSKQVNTEKATTEEQANIQPSEPEKEKKFQN